MSDGMIIRAVLRRCITGGKSKSMIKLIAAWAVIALLTVFLAYKIMSPGQIAQADEAEFSLSSVQIAIETKFETVDHISADELTSMDKDTVLIFDTRPQEEFAVSHIQYAVQIDPDMTAEDFLAAYENLAAGKTIVFYCSVGMRSSILAERVASKIDAPVYNLRGGIFGWHNDGRPLVSSNGTTDAVHPYDKTWGKLVTRQDKLSYK